MDYLKTSEIDKIQKILKKKPIEVNQNISHYNADDKCTAIFNWQVNTESSFDLSFVESVHNYYIRHGRCSEKQTIAIDNIITRFNIDIDRWS